MPITLDVCLHLIVEDEHPSTSWCQMHIAIQLNAALERRAAAS